MVEWITSDGLTAYDDAVRFMEARATAIAAGEAGECIWLLEHPPLYTAGTSAKPDDLTDPDRFEVHKTKRGGQYTYHGPGQRVIYVMLDVGKRGHDVRKFVQQRVNSTSPAIFARGASASGWNARTSRAQPAVPLPKTRSPPLASVCENGSAFTAFRSIWTLILSISVASCLAALPNTG
jgi:lipoyl protein ligase-like protein